MKHQSFQSIITFETEIIPTLFALISMKLMNLPSKTIPIYCLPSFGQYFNFIDCSSLTWNFSFGTLFADLFDDHPRSLLGIGMGLPEDTFVDMHRFDAVGESSGRLWRYSVEIIANYFLFWYHSEIHEVVSIILTSSAIIHMLPSFPRSEEEEERTKNVWLKGHTGTRNLCQPSIFIFLYFIFYYQTSGVSRSFGVNQSLASRFFREMVYGDISNTSKTL